MGLVMNILQRKMRREALQIVWYQLFGIITLSLIILLCSTRQQALSALLGGLAYCLPTLLFVGFVFRYTRSDQILAFMRAFFFGEFAKLIFSAILFLIIEKYLTVSLLSELIGFIGAIIAFWVACLCHFSRQKGVAR